MIALGILIGYVVMVYILMRSYALNIIREQTFGKSEKIFMLIIFPFLAPPVYYICKWGWNEPIEAYAKSWVECPYCGKAQRIFQKKTEKRIRCKRCRETFISLDDYRKELEYTILKLEDRVMELL